MSARLKRWIGGSFLGLLLGGIFALNIGVRIMAYGWIQCLIGLAAALVLVALICGAVFWLNADDQ